jgi:hypothetical protein
MGVSASRYSTDIALSNKTIIESALEIGADGIQFPCIDPRILSAIWLTKVEIPGIDLPEDSIWQVREQELMTIEDYDVVLSKGWKSFCQDFYLNRLDNLMVQLGPMMAFMPTAYKNSVDAGIVPMSGGTLTPPLEIICGGRSMNKFMIDLYRIPDKVDAVFKIAMADIVEDAKQQLSRKPIGIWIGGWRGASSIMNRKLWSRFVWPYLRELALLTIDAGVVPIFHLDSDWSRDLEYFKEFPKGKCIICPDGQTNIFRIKEVLGEHMCINGDVSATMLTMGTPDEVYKYVCRLIEEIGPTGFILGQGCDIPFNAKLENVKAMVAAARNN